MSRLFEDIKKDSLEARKARNTVRALLLSTLISDIEMIAKNSGRGITQDDVILTLKKFLKSTDEVIACSSGGNKTAEEEKAILENYLPKAPSVEELEQKVVEIISHGANSVGWVMKDLKFVYGPLLDGKTAIEIINKKLKV